MDWPKGIGGLCYGGDYNPEQWPEEVWKEDVALMRRAGVNLVSVGVFSWARLEPSPGSYDFAWLDRVLDLLHGAGVRVNLATPTASPPPWFGLAHPDALTVTADGTRLTHGSRDTYCVSAPAYREASARIAGELARRYRGHPALAMWHVHNEYGTGCHCDHAAAAFRTWLRGRYGTLDALNDAWTGSFWSQHHSAWEQVMPPRATQYLPNPAQTLDFRRFLSDEMLAHFREQKAVLREHTPDVPATTNFVLGDWVPVDHRRWAAETDLVAVDHYPAADPPQETAFAADLARGWAGGRPWLLMEQAVVTYTGLRMIAKRPGEITRLSLSHIARGSRGVMFFQWRASRGGAEPWHAGMVPHAGEDSGSSARSPSSARCCPPWRRRAGRRSRPGRRSCGTPRPAGPCRRRACRPPGWTTPGGTAGAPGALPRRRHRRRRPPVGRPVGVPARARPRPVPDLRRRRREPAPPRRGRRHPRGHLPQRRRRPLRQGPDGRLPRRTARPARRPGRGVPPAAPGTALYVSTRLPDADLSRLLGLEPSPLELVRRGEWVFAVNHGDDEQQVPDGPLLPPGGYAVRRARQG